MKKTTFLVAFCCLAFLSNAQNTSTSIAPAMETTSENPSQEPITTSNGVEVYYSSTTDQSGNTLLDIEFVNTSEETTTFTWTVTKDGNTFKGLKSITLKPGKTFNENAAFEVKGTTDLSDYSITLTFK